MKPGDADAFALEIGVLAEVLNHTLSKPAARALYDDLQGYALEDVIAGIRACRRTASRFPPPAELIELAGRAKRAREASIRALPAKPPSEAERRDVHKQITDLVARMRRGERIDTTDERSPA